MASRNDTIPDRRLIIALVFVLCVRLAFAAEINLIEDEAYYRLWGLYPSYAYFDHAPMVGWWIAIGQIIFGDNAFGLRVLSPVSAFIGSFFIWRIALISFDRSVANLSVIFFNAMPMIGIGGVMMTPDVPSVFFWGLTIWTLVEWNRSERSIWLIAFGVAAGFGLLSKYSNVFLGIGVLMWLVTSGRWRNAVRTPHFYAAGLIAVALFSPVIIWNLENDWASFSKQLGRLQSHGITLDYFGEWMIGQAMLISPILFAFVVFAGFRAKSYGLTKTPSTQLIIVSIIPMLGYFLFHVFSSRINANWTVPLYPNLAIFAAVMIRHTLDQTVGLTRRLAYSAAPLGYAMTIFVLIEALYPMLPADKRNPLSQLRGYGALSMEVRELARNMQAKAILTSRYQLTGQLSDYLRDLSIVQVTERIRFLNMPQPDIDQIHGVTLYIGAEAEAKEVIHKFRFCFKSSKYIKTLVRSDRGIVLTRYQVWQIEGLDVRVLTRGRPEDCGAGL